MFKFKRVRRYGKKKYTTYTTRFGKKSPYNSKSWKYNGKKVNLNDWYDTHDAFGKPRGYNMSDIMKFR